MITSDDTMEPLQYEDLENDDMKKETTTKPASTREQELQQYLATKKKKRIPVKINHQRAVATKKTQWKQQSQGVSRRRRTETSFSASLPPTTDSMFGMAFSPPKKENMPPRLRQRTQWREKLNDGPLDMQSKGMNVEQRLLQAKKVGCGRSNRRICG